MTAPVNASSYAKDPLYADLLKRAQGASVVALNDLDKDGQLAYKELNREESRQVINTYETLEGNDLIQRTRYDVVTLTADRAKFDSIDANKDGKLSQEELVEAYFRSEDKDGDGQITGSKGFLGLFKKGEHVSKGGFDKFLQGLNTSSRANEEKETARQTLTLVEQATYKSAKAAEYARQQEEARRRQRQNEKVAVGVGVFVGGLIGDGLDHLFNGG